MRDFSPWSSSAAACLRSFLRNEDGATAVEYALVAGGIAVAIVATVFALGTELTETKYERVLSGLKGE